ncbi:MAG: hypothetical protein H6674_10750 [Dehalococcoidia bacterium]|nr:hypothetical protein [Dehalococcoidia bacterium]
MNPEALDKLQRRLLAAVLVARFVVFQVSSHADGWVPAWDLVTIGGALAAHLGILAWRAAPASRRGADVLALCLLLSAVAAKVAMTAVALSDSSSVVGMHVYFAGTVWTFTGEAVAMLVVVAGVSIGRPTRAHLLALGCLALVGLDLGWRAIADSGFGRRGAVDPYVWRAAQLGLAGLLLGGVGWSRDPNLPSSSRFGWVVAACVGSWSLPLAPTLAAGVGVPPALVLAGLALCALLPWCFVLRSARSTSWPLGAAGVVGAAAVLGVATHVLAYAAPADLDLEASSIERWVVDAAATIGVVASARLLAVQIGRWGRAAQVLAGVASMLLAASHWREPAMVAALVVVWLWRVPLFIWPSLNGS